MSMSKINKLLDQIKEESDERDMQMSLDMALPNLDVIDEESMGDVKEMTDEEIDHSIHVQDRLFVLKDRCLTWEELLRIQQNNFNVLQKVLYNPPKDSDREEWCTNSLFAWLERIAEPLPYPDVAGEVDEEFYKEHPLCPRHD